MVIRERQNLESPFLTVPVTRKPAEPMTPVVLTEAGTDRDAVLPDRESEGREEITKVERMQARGDFQQEWINILDRPLKVSEVAWEMMRLISALKSPLGEFRQKLDRHAVAPGSAVAPFDLLPISVQQLEMYEDATEGERDWMGFIGLVLNYQYCSGFSDPKFMNHPKELTAVQRRMAHEHLKPAAQRLIGADRELPSREEVKAELERKGHDYDGSSWVKMEDLEYEKILSCWPSKDHAAVAPITKFLEGETLQMVKYPQMSILPEEEWPESLPKSYVRASQEEWNKLVKEGYERGLFQFCPEAEVLSRRDGSKVLNGAGAVPKLKKGEMKQRFISILCPLNAVSRKIEGSEGTLPYVGQVSLLHIPEEHEVVIDSEDMASAFNLFEMPLGWRGLFVYEKQVPASVLGMSGDQMVYVALRTIPMGWLSAVGIVQEAIRFLAFSVAKLPPSGEIQKWKELPKGQRFLLYLDSVDQLRVVSRSMVKVLEGKPSPEHERFTKACEDMGLPRNESKTLSSALKGTLQGGELDSESGVFTLQLDKMRMNLMMCLHLIASPKWKRKDLAGVAGRLVFAAAFRRPLLAAMEEVFTFLHASSGTSVPSLKAYDEIVSMVALLPLAFTNVRAPICKRLYATDASPTGAGSCVAVALKRGPGNLSADDAICGGCRQDLSDMLAENMVIKCPRECGKSICSLECYSSHYHVCPHKESPVPLFSERWSGPNCPLTRAVLKQGIDVVEPFDVRRSPDMDFFSESGKKIWDTLDEESIELEHHAPDCKTMSRARGKPFYIGQHRYDGPPALRDEYNVMGFPSLRGSDAVKVRQGNRMALRSVKRCASLNENGRMFTLEHPYRSFLWYMKPTIDLASQPGVQMAVFSNCCFGGRRRKWTSILTNCPQLFEVLHQPECPHGDAEDYQPFFDDQGTTVFPTEQEAEYPQGLVEAYALGARRYMIQAGLFPEASDARSQWLSEELQKYHRMADPSLKGRVVERLLAAEKRMVAGQEAVELEQLLRNAHYRGTDIRLTVEHHHEHQLIPYPAYRWVWRTQMAFKWKQEGHINELEAQALASHVRRILREDGMQQVRVMVVLDSQVLYFALGKGRSPARRLNRILRRVMALSLAGDLYLFPIWTLSAWNYADKPSRQ